MKNPKPYDLSLRWLQSEMECVVVIKNVDRDVFGFKLSQELKELFELELDIALDKYKNRIKYKVV